MAARHIPVGHAVRYDPALVPTLTVGHQHVTSVAAMESLLAHNAAHAITNIGGGHAHAFSQSSTAYENSFGVDHADAPSYLNEKLGWFNSETIEYDNTIMVGGKVAFSYPATMWDGPEGANVPLRCVLNTWLAKKTVRVHLRSFHPPLPHAGHCVDRMWVFQPLIFVNGQPAFVLAPVGARPRPEDLPRRAFRVVDPASAA